MRFASRFTVDRHGLTPSRWQIGEGMECGLWWLYTLFVIARRERKWPTRQSIVSPITRSGLSLRSLEHSGSPRDFSPRD